MSYVATPVSSAAGASPFRVAAFALVLFLGSTPFEWDDTMMPVYLAVACSAVAVLLAMSGDVHSSLARPNVTTVLAGVIVLHAAFVQPAPLNYLVLLAATFLIVQLVSTAGWTRPAEFRRAVSAVVVLNLGAFALQGALVYATGEVVDLHRAVFPTSTGRTNVDFLGVNRLSGLHIEPGTYSSYVALLVVLMRLLHGRFTGLALVATLSIPATYSAGGFVLFSVLMAWYATDALRGASLRRIGTTALALAFGVWLAWTLGIADHFDERFASSGDETVRARLLSFDSYARLSTDVKLVGFGFGREICENCSFYDVGAGLNLAMRGGLLVSLALIVWFASLAASRRVPVTTLLAGLAIALASKAAPHHIVLWMVLFAYGSLPGARR